LCFALTKSWGFGNGYGKTGDESEFWSKGKKRNAFAMVDSRDSESGSEEGDSMGMTNEAELFQ
jgi:hypothetical protein